MKTAYSPLRIEILLHYNISSEPIENSIENFMAPAVVEAVKDLIIEGALESNESGYRLTPLGKAWVQALCNVPIPRQVFVDEQGRIL